MPYKYKKVGNKYAVYKKSNGKLVGKTKGTKEALRKYLSALYINANEDVILDEAITTKEDILFKANELKNKFNIPDNEFNKLLKDNEENNYKFLLSQIYLKYNPKKNQNLNDKRVNQQNNNKTIVDKFNELKTLVTNDELNKINSYLDKHLINNKNYLIWILLLIKNKVPRVIEDLEQISKNLKIYDEFRFKNGQKIKVDLFDKNNLELIVKNKDELFKIIQPYQEFINFGGKKIEGNDILNNKKYIINGEAKKIFEDGNVLIITPLTYSASKFYGNGSDWCTASDNDEWWNDYQNKNTILYIIIFKNKKIKVNIGEVIDKWQIGYNNEDGLIATDINDVDMLKYKSDELKDVLLKYNKIFIDILFEDERLEYINPELLTKEQYSYICERSVYYSLRNTFKFVKPELLDPSIYASLVEEAFNSNKENFDYIKPEYLSSDKLEINKIYTGLAKRVIYYNDFYIEAVDPKYLLDNEYIKICKYVIQESNGNLIGSINGNFLTKEEYLNLCKLALEENEYYIKDIDLKYINKKDYTRLAKLYIIISVTNYLNGFYSSNSDVDLFYNNLYLRLNGQINSEYLENISKEDLLKYAKEVFNQKENNKEEIKNIINSYVSALSNGEIEYNEIPDEYKIYKQINNYAPLNYINEIFNNISNNDIEYQLPDSTSVSLDSKQKTKEYNLEYKGNNITLYIFITYDNNNNEIYNISFSINDRNDFVNINQKEDVTVIQIINYICSFLFNVIEKNKPGYLVIEHDNKKLLKIISFICNKHLPNCKTSFARIKPILTVRLYNNINENINNINEVFDNLDNLPIKDKSYYLTDYEENITQFKYKGNVLDLMYKIDNTDIYFSFRINGYESESKLNNSITPIEILVYTFSIIKKIIIKFKPRTISFDAEDNKFKFYKTILNKLNINDIKILSTDKNKGMKQYQVTIPDTFYENNINDSFNNLERYLLLLKNNQIKDLNEIPKKIWDDREFILLFLYYYNFHNLGSIEFLFRDYATKFNNDKEVVLCALSKDSTCEYYISDNLKNDKEIALTSVSRFGFMLIENEIFKNDKEVVLLALCNYKKAFEWLSEELKNDSEIIDLINDKEKSKLYYNENKVIYKYNPETKEVYKVKNNINENINNMNKLTIEEKTFINEQVSKSINNDLLIYESEYKGKKVTLNRPRRNPQGSKKKFHVYVKNEKGNVIKVQFGDPNMKIKRNIPSRKKAYRARHHCDNPGPKTKANYWSCQYGWGNSPVSKVIGENDQKLFEHYIRNEVKKILSTI